MMDIEANGNRDYFSGRGWKIAARVGRNVARLANCVFVVIGLLLTVSVVFADWGPDDLISILGVRDALMFVITMGVMGGIAAYGILGNYK